MQIGVFTKGKWYGRCVSCRGNSFEIEGLGATSASEVVALGNQGELLWDSWRARRHCLGCARVERLAQELSDRARGALPATEGEGPCP